MKRYAYAIWTRVALFVIYTTSLFLYAVLGVVQRLTRRRGPAAAIGGNGAQRKYELLIIGTFYTRNWCISHVTPLARAANVSRVIAVVDGPTQAMPNVTYAYPPRWAARIMGRAFSKFFYALWIAMRRRPALIMGYHLLPGALTALLVARASGARSGYQVTAGPIELIGGGAATENFFLKNLRTNSRVIEMLACSLARRFDLIVVRGRSALEFMRERGLGRHVCIVPGSIDDKRFVRDGRARDIDVVSVCRLVPIKQPDHIVRVIARLARSRPDCRAVVLGEGPMRESLWALIRELGIERNIELRGHVDNVEAVLARAKTFLLTSRSEGLSIAMAEAMVAGAVPVVADVGDLGDLVSNGRTGWLVRGGDFDAYAARIAEVIRDGDRLATYSDAAHEAAVEHNGVRNIAERWTRTVEQVCGAGAESAALRTKQGVERMLWGLSRHKLWRWLPAGVKRTVDPVLRHVPTRWALGRRFRRESQWLEDVQWWSADQTRAYQVERLRALLGDAYERTTFYRQSFDAVGFHPRDFRSVDDLARLPLIDQETVRQSLDEMCTIRRFGVGVDQVSTGGTCGRPLKFYIGADRSAIEYAYLVSSWSRAGFKLGTAMAAFRGEPVSESRGGLHYEYDPLLRRHVYGTFHMTDDNMGGYLSHVATIGPCYLHVYPSTVTMLAAYLRRSGKKAPSNIQGLLVGSENVYPDQREFVTQMFPVPFFSWYGHSEKLVLGAECEYSSHYHIWPTYGHFELLDEENRPIKEPGRRGEIVGTGFINHIVPFIRYRTGDYATYVGERCSACGREHPIITDVRGHRTQEVLVAEDGSLISWTALNMHDGTFDNVRQFQFYQERPGEAVLRVVPGIGFGERNVAAIHEKIGGKMAGRVRFEVEMCESIPLTQGGKSIYVEQRIKGAAEGLSLATVG